MPTLLTKLLIFTLSALAMNGLFADDSRKSLFEGDFVLHEGLDGIHPRLYADAADLDEAARRYQQDPEWCAVYLPDAKMDMEPAPIPLAQGVTSQRSAMIIAKVAVAWRITGEEKYHQRLREWIPVLNEYQPPVMRSIGGHEGLTGGHILLGLSIAYDIVYDQGDEELESALRDAIVRQGTQTYSDLAKMQHYAYEQNHLIIPVCGLGVAAMTLVDDYPEATKWGVFSNNVMQRTLDAIAYDGWFFEGFSYWNYTFQFPAAFGAAQKRTVGGDAFQANCFRYAPLYLAHMTLPDPKFVFDFADWGPRTEKDGVGFQSGYDWPWHTLPTRVKLIAPSLLLHADGGPQFLRDYLRHITPKYAEMTGIYTIDAIFGMLLQLPVPEKQEPMKTAYADYPPYHFFPDMGVMHWRHNWSDPDATALAFKSGPPAGHHFNDLILASPEWRPALGHAHPDAGSFLLFAHGVFLANDTGYTGAKESADHNTILVDGVGQHQGGTPWSTFTAKPYEEYNKIHMEDVWTGPRVAAATAVFPAAYDDAMKLTTMNRRLLMLEGRFIVVLDQMDSELPHTYEWRLHTDREPSAGENGRYVMTNHPGRLIIQNLQPQATAATAPTIVETSVSTQFQRPQQRGFHLSLTSPRQKQFEFLTALGIQRTKEQPGAFQASKGPGYRIDLNDGERFCSVWMKTDPGLEGDYAYSIRDKAGKLVAVGLSGSCLSSDGLTVKLDQPGQVTLVRDANQQWQVESSTGAATTVSLRDADMPAAQLNL